MFLFNKKKKEAQNTKFKIKDPVSFRYNGELTFGWIYKIKVSKEGIVTYDIQVGGQCPYFVHDIKEEDLHLRKEL